MLLLALLRAVGDSRHQAPMRISVLFAAARGHQRQGPDHRAMRRLSIFAVRQLGDLVGGVAPDAELVAGRRSDPPAVIAYRAAEERSRFNLWHRYQA
ncbi:hypothetical protein [Bradyrhizobium sp. ARR65]|uniref:hypothetical protein n=1 Tax=Bradyrhizobium sp. ARR65 TaxID=1040989 RepID=UPI0012FA026C|nr:hypothetical protein [Bradyrhizobium sp. ARR65]